MKNNKIIRYIYNNLIYITAFLLPLVILILNGAIWRTWPVFPKESSMLTGDAITAYVPAVYEFVHKVKNGGSIFYSWTAAGGFDYCVNFLGAIFTPLTLLMLFVKESQIPDFVQWIMALRWMLMSVSMVYFFQHTRHNTLKKNKKIVSLFLGLAFSLGNGILCFWTNNSWLDIFILFPFILLQLERLADEGKWLKYYFLLTFCMINNSYILFHVCIFLLFWFSFQLLDVKENRLQRFWIFVRTSLLAVCSSFLVMLPYLDLARQRVVNNDENEKLDFLHGLLVSFSEVISKFFVGTSLEFGFSMKPNIFLSVVAVILVLFFVFVKETKGKKLALASMALFMFVSFFVGYFNIIWHVFSVPHGVYNRFVNMFVFLLTFIVLHVFIHLEELRLRHIGIVSGILFILYIYVCVSEFESMKMHSFVITFILFVCCMALLCLARIKKISYSKCILFICLFGILELVGNDVYVMRDCRNATFGSYAYNDDVIELMKDVSMDDGERFAGSLYMFNTGMIIDQPSVNGFMSMGNGNAVEFSKQLGQVYSNGVTNGVTGASPVVNLLYNIRYCAGIDDTSFSDVEELKTAGDCKLYKTKHIAGLGYMVNQGIETWRIGLEDPFYAQNQFMNKATGVDNMFDYVTQPVYAFLPDGTGLEATEGNSEFGEYSYNVDTVDEDEEDIAYYYMKAESDYDLYVFFECSRAVRIGATVNGELKHQVTDRTTQMTMHLENVKKDDEVVFVVKKAQGAGKLQDINISCKYGTFNNECFTEAYEQIADEVYQIDEMSDSYIRGDICAKKDGVMMTSIPAVKGWTVIVDGNKVRTYTIGNTFIGIPLEEGMHNVEFLYETPCYREGRALTIFFVLLVLVMFFCESYERVYNNKVVAYILKHKIYVTAFAIPWVIVLMHSISRTSWLLGEGSLLTGNSGELYYSLYAELWDKLHSGGSLMFSWNAGAGTDFLVDIFRYMLSPAGFLLLLLPKNCLADGLQMVMILKWCAMFLTVLYYFLHTEYNPVKWHKEVVSLALTMAFCMSNAVIDSLQNLACCDVIIVFPILLLITEGLHKKKGYCRFVLLMAFSILCNYITAIPVSLFLVLWFVIGQGKEETDKIKNILQVIGCVVLSYGIASVVFIPCLFSGSLGISKGVWNSWSLSPADLVQRFFVFDKTVFYNIEQPALYCSVVFLTVTLFYCFTKIPVKMKIKHIILLLLIIFGLVNGGMNRLWHGIIGISDNPNDFAYLAVFLILSMALQVMVHMKEIKKPHALLAGITGIAVFVYAFIKIPILLEYYVYLGTVLLLVLFVLLIYFFSKGSIKYNNMLIVISVFAVAELSCNAYMRFSKYDEYLYKELYYREASEVLASSLYPALGERVAIPQDIANYGMILGVPAVSGTSRNENRELQYLIKQLGLGWDKDFYEYTGASPLLNVMFNVRYGLANSAAAFSDVIQTGKWQDYGLFQTQQLTGAGYMVDESVRDWNTDYDSPFAVQNDFVNKAAGTDGIFKILCPDGIRCDSVSPVNPAGGNINAGAGTHGIEKKYGGMYDAESGYFSYHYKNGFYGEDIKLQFISDGVTDYYVHVKSDCSAVSRIVIDEQTLYSDLVPARERTYHIGVVEPGTMVQIISNMEVDNDDWSVRNVRYQFADFLKDNYTDAYERIDNQTYIVGQWKDTFIDGTINAKESGIMMTCIPALPGFSVYVDGKQIEYDKIGNALIGVPLEAGDHQVRFEYHTPYIIVGMVVTLSGIILFILLIWYKKRVRKDGGD